MRWVNIARRILLFQVLTNAQTSIFYLTLFIFKRIEKLQRNVSLLQEALYRIHDHFICNLCNLLSLYHERTLQRNY
jgi:hypothetical protein